MSIQMYTSHLHLIHSYGLQQAFTYYFQNYQCAGPDEIFKQYTATQITSLNFTSLVMYLFCSILYYTED